MIQKDVQEQQINILFQRLSRSKFRSRFHLTAKDKAYVLDKGIEVIEHHAIDFVTRRLSPSEVLNDGKQTPMRGHPVFIAQHATATCCRGCLYKWHHIKEHKELTKEEISYVVSVIMTWIEKEVNKWN